MNLEHAQPDRAARLQSTSQADTRLHGGWLILARVAWVVLVLFLLGTFIFSLPTSFTILYHPCTGEWCTSISSSVFLTAREMQALPQYGLSLNAYAWSTTVINVAEALVWFGMGSILFWRKSDDWMALLVALMLISWGVNSATTNLLYSSSIWRIPENGVQLIVGLTILFTLALFPNGRFVPRWAVWITLINPAYLAVYLLFLRSLRIPGWALFNNPLNAVAWFGCWILLTLAQLYRYFRVSNTLERQQTKWVAFSFFLFLVGFGGLAIFPSPQPSQHNVLLTVLIPHTFSLMSLLIPISFGLAMFRYRLWDIDILINRTLVYGVLTASIIGMYILVVGYLGALFRTGNNLLISLIATGLVAVLFQPLRELLQRGVNRLLYGQRDEPYRVVSRLGQRLEATLAPEAVLPAIVETVAQALKLPYVAIILQQDGTLVSEASYGSAKEELLRLPLSYQSVLVGELVLAPRRPGESFTPADRALLSDLARQAGIATHAVRLTTDLQRLTGELQQSRTQLVTTREEERRRLRRDLHDGLGSALTSVTFQLDAACNLLDRDPQAVRTLLVELKGQMQTSIADIRRLVYNLRPPILDEWGLVAALREQVAQYQLNQVQVTVDAPDSLPTLPAAVEVAAYRIALEALANVTRHAAASSCAIRLDVTDEVLIVEIQDNGSGLPPDYHAGVGISAMRERAAELGGSCLIENVATGGTRVYARLPLLKE
ncbi:MAG TPA: histidine kinase [Ktedonobacter sp.]|jgi:signal transduction histidine kinase|nr:histidine kinase [Ktedonobacter sp.]